MSTSTYENMAVTNCLAGRESINVGIGIGVSVGMGMGVSIARG